MRQCADCDQPVPYAGTGRPALYCDEHRRVRELARRCRSRERLRDRIAVQRREYYERHRARILARNRERRRSV